MRRASLLATGLVLAGCGGHHGPARPPGAALFASAGCGGCHTLRAAGTHGGAGPDFDTSELLTPRQVRAGIYEGVNGMPSYRGRLTGHQVDTLVALIERAYSARRTKASSSSKQ